MKALVVLLAALLLVGAAVCQAESLDFVAKSARAKKGKAILCGPKAKPDGTRELGEVLASCPPGALLRLTPGDYGAYDIAEVLADNVVIEGDGSGGFCAIHLVVHGDGCVVRGVNLAALEGRNLTVVDSKIGGITLWGSEKGKVKSYVINCCAQALGLYPNNATFNIANTTIIQPSETKQVTYEARAGYGGSGGGKYTHKSACVGFGGMVDKGAVEFTDCVVYSNGDIFRPPGPRALLSLELKNNIIYAKDNLLTISKDKQAKKAKDLDEYFSLKKGTLGSNRFEQPEFETPLPSAAGDWRGWWTLDGKYFTLKKRGGGIGANLGERGMPAPKQI